MLVVNMMIIQCCQKLDRFYCIGVMNWLKKTFFWFDKLIYKNELLLVQQKRNLEKAMERYSKEKTAEFYLEKKVAIKKKSRDWYKNLLKEEKDKIK